MPGPWSEFFPTHKKFTGYLKLVKARYRFHDYISLSTRGPVWRSGYQSRLSSLRNKHKGQRCFVMGNGPSLQQMDLSPLANEITIGANGIYKKFPEWGFHTNYLVMEDVEQTEIRGPEMDKVKGPLKLFAIDTAHAVATDINTLFFYTPRGHNRNYYWSAPFYPQFSLDFAALVHLGSTVTHAMLQLAYHLGCDPIYIIGVDHNYSSLTDVFPPGKVTITQDNIHLTKGLHADPNYYKIGDVIGVPHYQRQEAAYQKARDVLESNGRRILNAGLDSKLNVFEKTSYDSIFNKSKPES